MLFNTTYTDKEDIAEMNALIGKPMGFIASFKLGGVGSGRMIIDGVSRSFQGVLSTVSDLGYGSIELRPNGVMIYITRQMERFCWVIPYYKLSVFNDGFFSIHSDNNFIRFRKDLKYKENKRFIDKMMHQKALKMKDYFL
ncbi:hypothetical protein [uncultured Tenacibaculum sp.]|uniref:hypothetical protein n=1 Tax=uncultured Tenacibaculum sp. TaxID=174713 RepID=UPI002636B927|nr:hypothetical protein [uncultured Tenacibaculum sp.]